MPFERQEEQPLLELAVRVEEGEEQGEGEEQWLAGGGGHQGQHDCLDTYLCFIFFFYFSHFGSTICLDSRTIPIVSIQSLIKVQVALKHVAVE